MPKKHTMPHAFLRRCIAVKKGATVRPTPSDGTLEVLLDPWKPGTTDLEAEMKAGDELWTWSNGDEACEVLVGRGGYALVGQGKIIDHLLVWMN